MSTSSSLNFFEHVQQKKDRYRPLPYTEDQNAILMNIHQKLQKSEIPLAIREKRQGLREKYPKDSKWSNEDVLQLMFLSVLEEQILQLKYVHVVESKTEARWNAALVLTLFFKIQLFKPLVDCEEWLGQKGELPFLNAELRALNEKVRQIFAKRP